MREFVFFLIWSIVPIIVVGAGSKQRGGRIQIGWIVLTIFLGWISAIAWYFLGRTDPAQSTYGPRNTPGSH